MKREPLIEIIVGAACLLIYLFTLKSFLLGQTSFQHDNTNWAYPIFHFFTESLLNGHLPLWNPFEHGGEPFYPLIGVARLFDPTDLLTIGVGSFFTRDTLILQHWARVVKTLVTLGATYVCIRPWIPSLWGKLVLFPLLLFSYYSFGSFREQSFLDIFVTIPFTYFFLQRILFFDDSRWINWIGIGATLGLNTQVYHFTAPSIFLLFLFVGLGLFRRDLLRRVWSRRALVPAAICLVMLAPNFFLFATQDRFVYPVRMLSPEYTPDAQPVHHPMDYEGGPQNITSPFKMHYSAAAYSGTVAATYVFVKALVPDIAFFEKGIPHGSWRAFHDDHIYISILVWALCLMGLLFDPSQWFRRLWGFCLVGLGYFLLGPGGGIHRILYEIYPPVSMFRHTIMLMPVALLPLLFLVARGIGIGRIKWRFDRITLVLLVNATVFLYLLVVRVPEAYAWTILIPGTGFLWYGHRRWHPHHTFWTLFLSPILVAGFLAPNVSDYAIHAAASLAVFALWQFGRLRTWAVLLFITADFFIHLKVHKVLYGQPSAVHAMGIDTVAKPPEFPKTRALYAVDFHQGPQAVRYLATLYRRPTAFSTPYWVSPFQVNTFERALFAPRWSSYLLPKHYFELIHSDYPLDKMERALAVGSDPIQFFSGPENHWSYQVESYRPGFLQLNVKSEQPGVLFWSDGYNPEWKATINGRPVRIDLAEKAFKSVNVPAGEHSIVFKFAPTLFLVLFGLYYGVFLSALGAMLVITCRERARRPVFSLSPITA